jgi:cyclopropane-fatty-acyl-phospholipid synthase
MNTQSPKRGRQFAAARPGSWARLGARRFHYALDRIDKGLEFGMIEAILPDGSFRVLGGRNPGPAAHVDLNKWVALVRLARSGSAGWYQAWEKGEWSSPDPVPLFDLFMRNRASLGEIGRPSGLSRLARRIAHKFNSNSRSGARRNIVAHYDLGNDFYRTWLDRTMSYSSAIFAEPIDGEEALEAAQERKVSALSKRLNLKPGSTILEIGCGWGFFSRHVAEKGGRVTAITLSPSQKQWAERALAGSGTYVDYRLVDYRDVEGQFDAIASIEMVEAVGQRYWPHYLDAIARCLKPGGRAAIQYIAIADDIFEAYAASVDFIQSHVFPGGMLLSQSRFRALAEARGLMWRDVHHFPLHYAETLRRWRLRFDDAVEAGNLPSGFDRRFVNLWRYYLMYCEGGFRGGGLTVAQVTLVKEGKCLEEVDSGRSLAAYHN